MYYGKGFTHSDVYNMPIYLRKFYYQKLTDAIKQERDQIKKSQKKSKQKHNPRFKI